MRQTNDALKFDPHVMALAMPTESGFTEAAKGIVNVGRVFQDQQERAQASELNALKMDDARESIKAKQFENSIAGEKWDQTKNTYTQDLRNKRIDGLKKQLDYDSEIKKAGDLEVTNQIKGMLPTPMFYKDGKFNPETLDNARTEFLNSDFGKKSPHIVNAVFDSKLKEIMDTDKAALDNSKLQSDIDNKNEDTKWIAPKAKANINQSNASAAASYASAHKSNVEASLEPVKVKAYVQQTDNSVQHTKVEGDKLKKDRMSIASDPSKMESMVPGYASLNDNQKLDVNNRYIESGVLPKRIGKSLQGDSDYGTIDADTVRAVYPAGTLKHTTQPKVTTPMQPEQSADGSEGYAEGTVIKNGAGIKMVMQNGKWVQMK